MICALGLAMAAAAGDWYMLDMRMVCESVGLLCRRLHLSPWRHAPIWEERGWGGIARRWSEIRSRRKLRSELARVGAATETARGRACEGFAHLEVEGAVHAVLLGAEDGGEMFGHGVEVSSLARSSVPILGLI